LTQVLINLVKLISNGKEFIIEQKLLRNQVYFWRSFCKTNQHYNYLQSILNINYLQK